MTNITTNTTPEQTIPLLRLKAATAPKLGQNAGGSIHYEVLADTARQVLLLRLTQNESGGNFSPEAVPFSRVQAVADALPPGSPVPSRVFRSCCRGRSQNNQGFLCCLLRAEGLLGPVEGKLYQHHVTGDWPAWAADMLRQPGEPAELPGPLLADVLPLDTPAPGLPRRGRGRTRHDEADDACPAH